MATPPAPSTPVVAPPAQAPAARMPRSLLPMSFGAIDLQSIYHKRLDTLIGHVNRIADMKEAQDKADKERRKKAKAEALAQAQAAGNTQVVIKPVTVASSKDLTFRRYRSSDQETLQTFVQTTPKTYANMRFIPTDFDAMARLFPRHDLIVCEMGDEIAGTIGYSQKQVRVFGHECTSIFGFDLRINPRFWRRGIGFHLIRRLRKMYNEVNPHWVHGFILQENVASLHMNREQCILTTMRWLGWSTENLLPEPGDTRQRSDSSEADNDADNDEEAEAEAEPDYTIRIVSAEEALTLLTETFALSNFFPLDMGTTILKSPFYHGTYVLTNSRGAYASVSLWDKGGVTKVELSGVRMAKRLTLWGMCYSGFDSDHDGVELLMTLIRHVHREVRAKGVGYLSAFLPSELPIAQELQQYATANALWYCIGVYFRDMYKRDSKRKHGTDPYSAPIINFGSSFFSDPRELLF